MAQCFTGETLVVTDEGLVAIEDIEIGDYVLAEDTVTGEQSYKEVLNVFVSQTNKLVHVTTTDNYSETTINTTDNHPFYVEGKGWVPAIELEAGDVLRTVDGDIEVVSKVDIEYLDDAVLIYNLEIEGYHTYFVSDERVLVHNTYDTGDGGSVNNDGGIPSGYYQDANGRWHRPNGQFASNAEVGIVSPDKVSTGSHGNSLSDPRTNYGYALVDRNTNEILKFGESINPSNRYTKLYMDTNNAKMIILEQGSKLDIHLWQHDMNEYYFYKYNEYPPSNSGGW